MNIFELILSEPQSYQQSDFAGQQGTWALFKQNITALFSPLRPADVDPLLGRSRELWTSTKRSSPELLPVMVEYYMSISLEIEDELERVVHSNLSDSLKAIEARGLASGAQLQTMLETVREVYILHEKYILIFDYVIYHLCRRIAIPLCFATKFTISSLSTASSSRCRLSSRDPSIRTASTSSNPKCSSFKK